MFFRVKLRAAVEVVHRRVEGLVVEAHLVDVLKFFLQLSLRWAQLEGLRRLQRLAVYHDANVRVFLSALDLGQVSIQVWTCSSTGPFLG